MASKVDPDEFPPSVFMHFVEDGLRRISSEKSADFFTSKAFGEPENSGATSEEAQVLARSEKTQPIPKQYSGKVAYQDGRPNILVVAHSASDRLFGSERSFLDMVDAIGRVTSNVFVVLPCNVPDYTNAIRPLCHRAYILDYKWWRKGEAISDDAVEAFKSIIVADKINAVHVNTIMLREPVEAARECDVPGIVHVRELVQHDKVLQDRIGESAEEIIKQTLDRAEWIVGNSRATAAAFAKDDRTFTIPNTIDVDMMDIANDQQDEVRFGLISSNLPKKGISDLIELARLASGRVKKAKFVIIGPDTDLVRHFKQQQKLGLVPDNVLFAGYASSPRQAVEQVHVVLNFSHFAESFGRTVLEAMAARRPVIGYRWGALPELIEHNKSGYIVPFRKFFSALPYVKNLCDQPETIKRFGVRGREIAISKFGLSNYRAQVAEAYAKILPWSALQVKALKPNCKACSQFDSEDR
jgi:glycosyltransferase involved in cell wall biosynthesis